MSEFTNHKEERIERLAVLFKGILEAKNLKALVEANQETINSCIPSDVVYLVDELVQAKIPMTDLKKGINKLLNLLYKTISDFPYEPPVKGSYLWVLQENNRKMLQKLNELKPFIKKINKGENLAESKNSAKQKLLELTEFTNYYQIKENVLFPVIEKYLPEFRCISVMWSFHDDIKQHLKKAIMLLTEATFELRLFNRLAGDMFFNMNAIKFREEQILYPLVAEIVPANELNNLFADSLEIGFPYFSPKTESRATPVENIPDDKINLETGNLTVSQIKSLFNHLPVDITFVDAENKVRYFSAPKKRIFPRTKAILGRDVHNCHPQESVHVVEKIVQSFRDGKKDQASFWITMKGERLLIQYFAIRDEVGKYQGVVEVSQDITAIQNLRGENRLLDWED